MGKKSKNSRQGLQNRPWSQRPGQLFSRNQYGVHSRGGLGGIRCGVTGSGLPSRGNVLAGQWPTLRNVKGQHCIPRYCLQSYQESKYCDYLMDDSCRENLKGNEHPFVLCTCGKAFLLLIQFSEIPLASSPPQNMGFLPGHLFFLSQINACHLSRWPSILRLIMRDEISWRNTSKV